MLAQIIQKTVKVYDRDNKWTTLRFGTIVFVAKRNRAWSAIIHNECVFTIVTNSLHFMDDPKDKLTKPQVVKQQTIQDKKNMKAIDSFFSSAKKER